MAPSDYVPDTQICRLRLLGRPQMQSEHAVVALTVLIYPSDKPKLN